MYKPHTVEQYKICRYLKDKEGFALEQFSLSPLSRNALLLEDRKGEKIAFEMKGELIQEIPVPVPATADGQV